MTPHFYRPDMNRYDLDRMVRNQGLDPSLIAKLTPYLGLKKHQALAYLAQHPLSLKSTEAESLTYAKYGDTRDLLETTFNAAVKKAGGTVTFATLPPRARSVAMSVAIQHGPHLEIAASNFFGYLVNQDWKGLVAELRNFGDAYSSRRNQEADYLTAPQP